MIKINSVGWLKTVFGWFFFSRFFDVSTDVIENENRAKKGVIQRSNNVKKKKKEEYYVK